MAGAPPVGAPPTLLQATKYRESAFERSLARDEDGAVIPCRNHTNDQWRKDGRNLPPPQELHDSILNLTNFLQNGYVIPARFATDPKKSVTQASLVAIAKYMACHPVFRNPLVHQPKLQWTQQDVDQILDLVFYNEQSLWSADVDPAKMPVKVTYKQVGIVSGYMVRDNPKVTNCDGCKQGANVYMIMIYEASKGMGTPNWLPKCGKNKHWVCLDDARLHSHVQLDRNRAIALEEYDSRMAEKTIDFNRRYIIWACQNMVHMWYLYNTGQHGKLASRSHFEPNTKPQEIDDFFVCLEQPEYMAPKFVRTGDECTVLINRARGNTNQLGSVATLQAQSRQLQADLGIRTAERDQAQADLATRTAERDQAQADLTIRTAERDTANQQNTQSTALVNTVLPGYIAQAANLNTLRQQLIAAGIQPAV